MANRGKPNRQTCVNVVPGQGGVQAGVGQLAPVHPPLAAGALPPVALVALQRWGQKWGQKWGQNWSPRSQVELDAGSPPLHCKACSCSGKRTLAAPCLALPWISPSPNP